MGWDGMGELSNGFWSVRDDMILHRDSRVSEWVRLGEGCFISGDRETISGPVYE